MPFEFEKGDRVETPLGRATVVGFIGVGIESGKIGATLRETEFTEESQFAIEVLVDWNSQRHTYANINVIPTVTTEIIHAIRDRNVPLD